MSLPTGERERAFLPCQCVSLGSHKIHALTSSLSAWKKRVSWLQSVCGCAWERSYNNKESLGDKIQIWEQIWAETIAFCLCICPVLYPTIIYHPILCCPLCRSEQLQCWRPCPYIMQPLPIIHVFYAGFLLLTVTSSELQHGLRCSTYSTDTFICLSQSHQFTLLRIHYHFTPGCDTAPLHWDKKRKHPGHTDWYLPVFSRCMMMGCSRFPPSCSGTPATSVCCSSPGLGSFLRPRSAASWAPRIGRRTETGTYFTDTLTRRKDPKQRQKRRRQIKRLCV